MPLPVGVRSDNECQSATYSECMHNFHETSKIVTLLLKTQKSTILAYFCNPRISD